MQYFGPVRNPYQTAYNNYLPILSSYPFGNSIFANMGQSNAFLSGNVPLEINSRWAQTGPELFPFPGDDPPTPGPVPAPVPNPYPNGLNQEQQRDAAGPVTGETRLGHVFKLQFVGIAAIVILAIGLYLIIRGTDTYKKAETAVLDAAQTAATVAAV